MAGQLKQNITFSQLKAKMKLIQHQLHTSYLEEIAKMKFTKHYFENTNKPRIWVAYKLKKEKKITNTGVER